MFTKTIENTSPKRQRVKESQGVHSLALRACNGAEHDAVQLGTVSAHENFSIQFFASC
jgi:hypothetical protein